MRNTQIKKLLIIFAVLTLALFFNIYDLFDIEKWQLLVKSYSDQWWVIIILVIVQILLFTFALAGSLVFWITAPLYPPVTATLILASGATLGGVGAYYFSAYVTDDWVKKIEKSHAYRLLHNQDDFFALFALRIFPAFPHALVNYSSGILKVKLTHFIAAAFLGVGIKTYVYANIVYNLSSEASFKDLLNIKTILPLVLLSLITLIGVLIKYKKSKQK